MIQILRKIRSKLETVTNKFYHNTFKQFKRKKKPLSLNSKDWHFQLWLHLIRTLLRNKRPFQRQSLLWSLMKSRRRLSLLQLWAKALMSLILQLRMVSKELGSLGKSVHKRGPKNKLKNQCMNMVSLNKSQRYRNLQFLTRNLVRTQISVLTWSQKVLHQMSI